MDAMSMLDMNLLAAVSHFFAADGEESRIDLRTLQCLGGVNGLDNVRSIRQLLQKWVQWGMVRFSDESNIAVINGRVMEVLLATSAKVNSGRPSVLHRVCYGFACMSPGKISVQEKADIQVVPPALEDFGFKKGEGRLATLFFNQAEKCGFLWWNGAGVVRMRFVSDPFLRLAIDASGGPLGEKTLDRVISGDSKKRKK